MPKLRLVGLALRVPGATPVAEMGIFSVGLEALLVIARLPLTVPAACGANTTLKLGLLWPGSKVKGRLKPFILSPAPVTLACEMVSLEPPVLVSVSVKVLLFPV